MIHPRLALHVPATLGDALSDAVASAVGSWPFLLIQTALVALWVAGNAWWLAHPFDPWPFLALNILFSLQAAYTAPVLMMSQNRQAAKDRARDDLESDEVALLLENSRRILAILEKLGVPDPPGGGT